MLAIVDTGPLYAAVDGSDADHQRCVAALETRGLRLVVPAMVVAEASHRKIADPCADHPRLEGGAEDREALR